MSSSKDEQLFNKAVQMYVRKYKLNVYSLLKFIDQKVSLSLQNKNIVQQQILAQKTQEASIDKEDLKKYLHLISAIQSKVDIRGKKIQSFSQFYKLSFKSSKDEKGKASTQQNQKKQEVKIQIKVSQANKKVQQKALPVQKMNEKLQEQPKVMIPNKQSRKSRQQPAKSPTKKLQIIQQDVVDQNRISDANVKASNTQQLLLKIPQAQMMNFNTQKYIQITGYDKFGQNYLRPIIKFNIVFQEKSVLRRYSEFEKLIKDLGRRFQGFILPELPPKEGIKSNWSFIGGVDEAFLNQRQEKLQQMLNSLINSKFINQDQILIKFLTEQDFQIQQSSQGGTISKIKEISSVFCNTSLLNIYGRAYYNFITEFKKSQINTIVTVKYKEVQSLLNLCLTVDNYRNSINSNFEHRRDLFKELKMDQNDRNLTITKFDKLSATSASQIRNLSKEVDKYLGLKSDQSWLNHIIRLQQPTQSNIEYIEQRKKEKEQIAIRIITMQKNLLYSIEQLKNQKTQYLEQVGDRMIEWRKSIHP